MLNLPPLKRSTSLSEAVDVINAWQEQNMQARQAKYELLQALITLRMDITQGYYNNQQGICNNLKLGTFSKGWRELYKLFDMWPENRSGGQDFPVPDHWAIKGRSNLHAYYHHIYKWSRFKSYGRARRRLLNWMIKELSKELEREITIP